MTFRISFIFTLFLLFASTNVNAAKKKCPVTKASINKYVNQSARQFNLPPRLIHAIIKTESNYDACAVSNKKAYGLMQLLIPTAKEMGVLPFGIKENIHGGTKYLSIQIRKFGLEHGIAAYNCGPGNMRKYLRKYGKVSPYNRETNNYVRKVLRRYNGSTYSHHRGGRYQRPSYVKKIKKSPKLKPKPLPSFEAGPEIDAVSVKQTVFKPKLKPKTFKVTKKQERKYERLEDKPLDEITLEDRMNADTSIDDEY